MHRENQDENEHTMDGWWRSSLFEAGNSTYVEELYEAFLVDPEQVGPAWRNLFQSLSSGVAEVAHSKIVEQLKISLKQPYQVSPEPLVIASTEHESKQIKVLGLIHHYRLQGHLQAHINPMVGDEAQASARIPELSLEGNGFSEADHRTLFDTETFVGPKRLSLKELFQGLNEAYCGTVGIEYMHLSSLEERRWLQQRIENTRAKPKYNPDRRKALLEKLTEAEGLERYLGAKFPGAKRFSLEGADILIPMVEEMIMRGGAVGIKEIVIGMAHRGRLNMLVNILGKKPLDLFGEFAGKHDDGLPSGDVKYHQGFSSDWKTSAGNVHIALAFNPSHLEIVSPVVMGSVRARQHRRQEAQQTVMPIAIHGDAAFAGQGVVMETLNMSQTRGYTVGGTVHIVVNNQVGFTTSNPLDTRSTRYCTDVAKMIESPIFHVNADDVEACIYVTQLALDFRMNFKKDVIIDLVCYRRHGHNEADEPAATQPLMYQFIRKHPTVRELYARLLEKEGVVSKEVADALLQTNRSKLDDGDSIVKPLVRGVPLVNPVDWTLYLGKSLSDIVETALTEATFKALGRLITTLPEGYKLHPRVGKLMEDRSKMAEATQAVDWGFAENLAYASILKDGYGIRLSGQDSGRGTFFHRHAVLHHQETGEQYIPLKHLSKDQGHFTVIDSLLSEEAVLGFEYGYASAEPRSLVIWEAQFGDFANGAQVVIDQFISSGEQKWGRLCGLTLLLPHGYEGQGPEHSSARLERFLQLSAEENMQICVPSTPAQVFHMLRRQMVRPARKPLIVMSPKSLLRHRLAVSNISEFTEGGFQSIIDEKENLSKVRRVVLCSGRVYYDLVERRAKSSEALQKEIAILRIEQLYPFPEKMLHDLLHQKYGAVSDIVWCQDEPQNQGAWLAIQGPILECLNKQQRLRYAGRKASAAPACGHHHMHEAQQEALIEEALGGE